MSSKVRNYVVYEFYFDKNNELKDLNSFIALPILCLEIFIYSILITILMREITIFIYAKNGTFSLSILLLAHI
jgi:hypothetical protein